MKDRTAVNHNIRKHFNELIYNTARYTEIALSIVIIIVIALSGLRLFLYAATGRFRMAEGEYGRGLCKLHKWQ